MAPLISGILDTVEAIDILAAATIPSQIPNGGTWDLQITRILKTSIIISTYQRSVAFATSPDSAASSTYMTVECEPARLNYSANPRCDSYGQNPATLPWGP